MHQLRVFLLGKFHADYENRPVAGLEKRKIQEMFSYLLLNGQREHAREALAGLLWSDSDAERARRYLRKAIWQLQTALQACSDQKMDDVLLLNSEWVGVNRGLVWVDCQELERLFSEVRDVSGRDLAPSAFATLDAAAQLYHGELLEGCYEDWCLLERERLQHIYLCTLDKLMGYCEAQGEYQAAIDYAYRILRYDRAREHTHRRLMRLRFLAGDRTGALTQYRRCVRLLKRELNVAPTAETQALYAQICAGALDQTPPAEATAAAGPELPVTPADNPLCQLLEPLQQLQTTLAAVQAHIERSAGRQK